MEKMDIGLWLQAVAERSLSARAGRLLGAQVVLVGMSAEVLHTFIENGIELSGITMLGNLQAGLDYALALRGLFVFKRPTKDGLYCRSKKREGQPFSSVTPARGRARSGSHVRTACAVAISIGRPIE
jgi:hypothetical protein